MLMIYFLFYSILMRDRGSYVIDKYKISLQHIMRIFSKI